MSKIHLLDASSLLLQAFKDFSMFYHMDWKWESKLFNEATQLSSELSFVVHNESPESLETIERVRNLRNIAAANFCPVLVMSEELSPAAFHLYNEIELVWQSFLPFDAKEFFHKLEQVVNFARENQELIVTRTKIANLESEQKFSEAIKLIEKIESDYSHQNQLQLAKAQILLKSGESEAAKDCLKMLKRKGFDGLVFRELVMNVLNKPLDDSKKQEKIKNLKKSNNKYWGDRYMENGQPDSAHDSYKAILGFDPDEEQKNAALVGMKLAEFAGASSSEHDLQNVDPLDVARALNKRSVALVANGEYNMAEDLYQKAIAALPDRSLEHKLWFNLALCFKKKGDLQKSLGYFLKASKLAPDDFPRAAQHLKEVQKLIEFEKEEAAFMDSDEEV